MSVYKGKKIRLEITGSSHGEKIIMRLKGLKGLSFDYAEVENMLKRRSAKGKVGATERIEKDEPKFIGGVKNGRVTGEIVAEFTNGNVRKSDYDELYGKPRPSHADIGRYFKSGELDYCGGGEFSGRMTVALCLAGAIAKSALKKNYGSEITARLTQAGKIANATEQEYFEEIERAKADGDSVGARVECIATNVPKGLGGAMFDGLEGKIAALCYAIPAVKGVSFGKGFGLCSLRGSEANDEITVKDEKITFLSNNDGGIYGGISCGDICVSVAFKPIPSIKKQQNTVNLLNYENAKISVNGRHDVCAALRALPVVEAAVALAITDEVLYERSRKTRKT